MHVRCSHLLRAALRRAGVTLLASLALGSPHVARGQTAPPVAREEALLLSDLPTNFGASRFDQASSDAPASVTVITAEEIAAYGWRNLADVLRSVRGITVTNDRAYQSVGMRGFGRPGEFSQRVLLLLDGVRQNDNIFDRSYYTSSIIDPALIERIEIIRGPGAALYGPNAVLGVINIVSKRGRARQGVQATYAGESFGGRDISVSGGARSGRDFEFSASANVYKMDGRSFQFPSHPNPFARGVIRPEADREEREQFFGKLRMGNVTIQGSVNDRTKRLPTMWYNQAFNDDRSTHRDLLRSLAAQWQQRLGDKTDVSLLASAHDFRFVARYPFQGVNPAEPAAITEFNGTGTGNWQIVDGHIARQVGSRHRVMVGGMYLTNSKREFDFNAPGFTVVKVNTTGTTWSVFAQSDVHVSDRLSLSGGLRRDEVTGIGAVVSPRAAVIAKYRQGGTLKLLYGEAFRAPNMYERNFTDGGRLIPQNPDIQPEFFTSYEALVEQVFTPNLKGTLSLYRNDAQASIGFVALPSQGAPIQRIQQQNLNNARSTGVEAEVEVDVGGFAARSSVAVQRSTDRATGNVLANSPSAIGALNVMSPLLLRNQVRVAIEGRGMSARRDLDGTRVAPHAIGNIIVSSAPRVRGPVVTLGVYNVFDARYYDPTSFDTPVRAVRQDPRNLRLAFAWGI